MFAATGKHFCVAIQHNSSGMGVILDITGWKYPRSPPPAAVHDRRPGGGRTCRRGAST
ncbi:MAG TPA: hypothetical protein VHM89_14280 [Acidimicrobiales bacterium]|nr:hypothetical protein [Acidimicrobiales bacterium]